MNLTSEQPAAFSALVEILDSFFYDTSIHTVQREKKIKKSKKMTKKTIKLKAAVKKKHCSIMVCIQICPGYIVSLWWVFLYPLFGLFTCD